MSNAALLATAKKLIGANGALVTFTRIISAGHDAVLGAPTTATVSQSVRAVLDASSDQTKGEAYAGDGTKAVKRLWIAGPDMSDPPVPGDTVAFEGFTWKVTGCEKVNPDGTTYIYSVHVAR